MKMLRQPVRQPDDKQSILRGGFKTLPGFGFELPAKPNQFQAPTKAEKLFP